MRSAFLAAALLAFAIAPCAANTDFPLGRWYTEGSEDGYFIQYLTESRPDHTFSKKGAYVTDCAAIQPTTETGTWTFDGGRYGQVTQTVDGKDTDTANPEYTDAFDVATVDANHITMFDPKTGVTWSLERVADFKLPPSAHCAT